MIYLLDIISMRPGTKSHGQIVEIPMGTHCTPLIADLFLFCYERDFTMPLSSNTQTDVIEAFTSTSKYIDDLLNIEILILKELLVKFIVPNCI